MTIATTPDATNRKAIFNRLDRLKVQQEILNARIQDMEAREKSRRRKDATRLKVLAGAALLADIEHAAKTDPSLMHERRAFVQALLNRAIQKKNDREFLKRLGWLP